MSLNISVVGKEPDRLLQLGTVFDGGFRMIRPLSFKETSKYIKAYNQLLAYDEASSLVEMLHSNLVEFEACVDELVKLRPKTGEFATLKRTSSIEVNRLFLNFLSAFRQFLDHTETRLKREYKEFPEVFNRFKERASSAYDNEFAYRFIYKLRNFSQHCGIPVGVVDFECKYDEVENKQVYIFHLMFDVGRLLAEGNDVLGKVVRSDLKKFGLALPVEPLPRKVMSEVDSIWELVSQLERPYLEESARYIASIVGEVRSPCITPAVFRVWNDKKTQSLEFLTPPLQVMDWLVEHPFKSFL